MRVFLSVCVCVCVQGAYTFEDLCKEVSVALVVKWRVPAQQNVGDDSDTPDVNGLSVGLLCQNFRSCQFLKKF